MPVDYSDVSRQHLAEFSVGQTGDNPANRASSLDLDSEKFNDQVAHSYTPNSVLAQYIPSANGLGATDAGRRLIGGGLLPTANGSSLGTYEADLPLRLSGQNT